MIIIGTRRNVSSESPAPFVLIQCGCAKHREDGSTLNSEKKYMLN